MSQEAAAMTVVSKATKALSVQVAALAKTTAEVQSLVAMVPELTDEISLRTTELRNIDQEIKDTLRTRKAELNIQVLENEQSVMQKLLAKNNRADISKDDLADLQERLAFAENDANEKVATQVAAVKASLEAKYRAETNEMVAEHKVKTAALEAERKQLADKVEFYKGQIATMQSTIDSERQARIEVAKHSQPIIQQAAPAGR